MSTSENVTSSNHVAAAQPNLGGAKHVVAGVIETLISLNIDSANAYETATELLESEQYREICRTYSEQHKGFADELRTVIGQYGGSASDDESFRGLMQDAWMNLRNLVDDDDTAVIVECDRTTEHVVNVYFDIIEGELPDEVKQLVRKQFAELKGEHERIHRLAAALQQT
ncbi:MAG TPA: PA2169 family four-helix-bundle protein [Caldilineaceae bacterium]|nr:PA2169 family four-helix-bundle protein [Caldilineaceae bacterium]